jgi:hypothetical protein
LREPKETSAPNRIKPTNPEVLISRRGFENGADGEFIEEDPLVTEIVYHKIETLGAFVGILASLESYDYSCERGVKNDKFFKIKRTGIVYQGEWKVRGFYKLGRNSMWIWKKLLSEWWHVLRRLS